MSKPIEYKSADHDSESKKRTPVQSIKFHSVGEHEREEDNDKSTCPLIHVPIGVDIDLDTPASSCENESKESSYPIEE